VRRKRGATDRKKPATRNARPRASVVARSGETTDASIESETPGEKLQKVLARAGKGSRREMETWIEAGRVTVDGKPATLGDRVAPEQVIRVDGQLLDTSFQMRPRVIAYHKPDGEICSRDDPEGRPSVFDHLPRLRSGRWLSVGRLDFNTSGLLLFTNDGELVNALTHPSSGVEREYAVRVTGVASDETLRTLKKEVILDDGPSHFDDITDGGGEGTNHWYYVTLREGRYREVRRMWEAVGHPVTRLIRTRYGPIIMPRSLHRAKRIELEADDIKALYECAGLKPPNNLKPASRRPVKPRRR